MRHAAAISLVVLVLGLSGATSRAGSDPAAELAELHRVRGTIAWQRAVWRTQREDFQRVVTELERARAAAAGRSEFTSLFLLGISYLRLGRAADAEPVLRDARALAPTFAGFILADALQATATKAESPAEARRQADVALAKYDEYIVKIEAYPKDGAFAAELRFLGYFFRGRTFARIQGSYDRAVEDLTRAIEIAKENDQVPAADLVSLLAQMHQSLNQIEEAKKLILEALARDPGEAAHYYYYGVLVMGTHDQANARRWLEAALARRADFPEAHLRLAYLASSDPDDPPSMRRHLEAAAATYEARARGGAIVDARVQADLQAGLGLYWKLVAKHRVEAGDDSGAQDAYREAKNHLREALAKEPGCVRALNLLIQIGSLTDAPEAEIEDLKRRLADTQKPADREIDPYHSTFC